MRCMTPARCCQVTQSALQRRRAVLQLPAAAVLLLVPLRGRAAEEASPLGMGQPVRPALPAQAYVKEIRRRREETLQSLRAYAQAGQFKELSDSLVLSPFDDLRQACFYLPWAVVSLDEVAGTELEGAWQTVRSAWENLYTVSLAAARFEGDEPEVRAAIDTFEQAVYAYQAKIPASLAGL